MRNSRALARLIGPTMIVLGVTEAINIKVFAGNAPPVVYFNGTVLFVAGLAIVLAHNLWKPDWRVLVTLTGWITLAGGLYRMFAPAAPQAPDSLASYVGFAALAVTGGLLCLKAYFPAARKSI